MRRNCTLGGRRRAVAAHHLARSPTREAHQVAFLSPANEPLVGEGVTKLVGVQPRDPRLRAAALEHLADAALGVIGPRRPSQTAESTALGWERRARRYRSIDCEAFTPTATVRIRRPFPSSEIVRVSRSMSSSISPASSESRAPVSMNTITIATSRRASSVGPWQAFSRART